MRFEGTVAVGACRVVLSCDPSPCAQQLPSKDDWITAPAHSPQVIRGGATDWFNGCYSDKTFENYYKIGNEVWTGKSECGPLKAKRPQSRRLEGLPGIWKEL